MKTNKNCTVSKYKFSPELYCPDKFIYFHKGSNLISVNCNSVCIYHRYHIKYNTDKYTIKD